MKQLLSGIVLAAGFICLFASCDKKYTCTCLVKSSGSDHVVRGEIDPTSKNDAQKKCDAMQLYYMDTFAVNKVYADCHL